MSRTKKAAKRKHQHDVQTDTTNKKRIVPGVDLAEPRTLNTVVSQEEVEIAVDTLRTLAQYPAVIKSKACKEVRTAVYDFKQACTTGLNTSAEMNLTSRISAAIVDGKFVDALVVLAEMRIRGESPKLGALCRWVRDLDVTSGLSIRGVEGSDTKGLTTGERQLELLRVLDAIARVTGTADLQPERLPSAKLGPISLCELWDLRDKTKDAFPMRAKVLDGTIFEDCPTNVKDNFKVLEITRGAERKPPNSHDAVLHLSSDNSVPLSATPPEITYHKHPSVPNLSLMKNVLSPKECKSIIAAMETIGFQPDAPIRDDGSESSILAHNVYWIVDGSFHDVLWQRVKPYIPSEMEGKKVQSINRRFRVYRYVPGAEYRVHFDGAWPPSGVNPSTGKYMWDASPADSKQSSLYTFLVYLNDEFEGGETTFFTPSPVEGVLNAHPVRPIMGCIALFPHGDSKGALLHEGTGVRKGAKYIIRTDVEYDVEPGGRV